jgi:hypothetical protein
VAKITGLEFTSSIVGATAWPLAVCLCVIVFRQQLGGLVGRLESVQAPGGIHATFGREVEVLRDDVAVVRSAVSPDDDENQLAHLLELADESPRAAVIDAWLHFESELGRTAYSFQIERRRAAPDHLMTRLTEETELDPRWLRIVRQLEQLKDQAVESAEVELRHPVAIDYVRAAIGAAGAMRSLRQAERTIDLTSMPTATPTPRT